MLLKRSPLNPFFSKLNKSNDVLPLLHSRALNFYTLSIVVIVIDPLLSTG